MKPITRRNLLVASGIAVGTVAEGLWPARADEVSDHPKLKVVVAGGHPGDPEAACGGTMARLADLGHEVVALYVTRGEAGIRGKTHVEAGAIRTEEAKKACELLKARAVFANQEDGATQLTPARYEEFRKLLDTEKPQMVFTHWPIDTHRDHRTTSLLVYDAWLAGGRKFALYYYEVSTGEETQLFQPTHYVNITATESRKRSACFAHASQDPASFYAYHQEMQRFRSHEFACKQAEAFIHHHQSPAEPLPKSSMARFVLR
jgi:LmbE family N-acetylglucosaminyl deacetylase